MRAVALSRLAFAALVAASVGALFYAQALKRKTLLLTPTSATINFAPAGSGGRYDRQAHFPVRLTVGGEVVVSVLTTDDRPLAVVARRRFREYQTQKLHWTGVESSGALAPPGYYLLQIELVKTGQTFIAPGFRLHLIGGSG
ncbi:MAG TPA: hypothetical protein VID68_03930 [Solirubrobacteraceae bacterium]